MEFDSEDKMLEFMRESRSHSSFVSISLAQGSNPFGTIVIELFSEICPATSKHFCDLILGPGEGREKIKQGLIKSPIHRIVKNAYIQGGDVTDGSGKGDPHFSIADETFAVKHDDVGILGMANNGPDAPHSAATQFYITLRPLNWLDGKKVAFGKVLTAEGLGVLKKLESLDLNNERPIPEVTISGTKLWQLAQPQ